MAKGRLISTSFWDDSKVVDDFTPEDKYIYLYCMTNPHTNLCGCYEVSVKQIASETGYNEDTVKRLLMRLDREHNVIRYSSTTKEMLMLNWFRYNWSTSEKLNKPLLAEIRAIKDDGFREYLAGRYNERDTVTVPYGQGTVTFEAYVSGVEDELKRMGDGFNRWGGLTVTFTAMSPKRRP